MTEEIEYPCKRTANGNCGGCPGCQQCGCSVNSERDGIPTVCPFPESPCGWHDGDMPAKYEYLETWDDFVKWCSDYGVTVTVTWLNKEV